MVVENTFGQLVVRSWLEPFFVGVVDEIAVGDVFAEELVVVEEVAAQAFDEFTQCRAQCAFLGGTLAVGEAHRGGGISNVQRPHVGHDVAPGGDFDLHAQVRQYTAHVGDGLFQREVLALDVGAGVTFRRHQQGLGVFVEVFDGFNLELGAGLYHFFHGAAVD